MGLVLEDVTDSGQRPMRLACRGRNALICEVFGDTGVAFTLHEQLEYQADCLSFLGHDLRQAVRPLFISQEGWIPQ